MRQDPADREVQRAVLVNAAEHPLAHQLRHQRVHLRRLEEPAQRRAPRESAAGEEAHVPPRRVIVRAGRAQAQYQLAVHLLHQRREPGGREEAKPPTMATERRLRAVLAALPPPAAPPLELLAPWSARAAGRTGRGKPGGRGLGQARAARRRALPAAPAHFSILDLSESMMIDQLDLDQIQLLCTVGSGEGCGACGSA